MSKKEIASLVCKILGVYIIIQGLNAFANVIPSYLLIKDSIATIFISMIFPFGFLIIFGIILWVFSEKLSTLMVEGERHTVQGPGIEANELQRVAFSVLGLFFIGTSFPKLVSNLINFMTINEMMDATTKLWPSALGNMAQLIIGLGIFFGAKGLVNLLKKIRYTGFDKEEDRWDKD